MMDMQVVYMCVCQLTINGDIYYLCFSSVYDEHAGSLDVCVPAYYKR